MHRRQRVDLGQIGHQPVHLPVSGGQFDAHRDAPSCGADQFPTGMARQGRDVNCVNRPSDGVRVNGVRRVFTGAAQSLYNRSEIRRRRQQAKVFEPCPRPPR
jgi:hypothetical protein